MLTEEALILLATLGASGLLVLGVVELAWPSTPRRPARRARPVPPARFESPVPRAAAEETQAVPVIDAPPAEAPVASAAPETLALAPPPPIVAAPPPPVEEPATPRRPTLLRRVPRAPRGADWRQPSAAPAVDPDSPVAAPEPKLVPEQ